MWFVKIVPYLGYPLVLIGFALLLFFGLLHKALKKGPRGKAADRIVKYGFATALVVTVLGFATELWGNRVGAKDNADPPTRPGFDLTVRASAPGVPIITTGSVIADFGNDRRTAAFGKTGEADFKGVPEPLMRATIQVIALVPGFVEKSYDVTISGSVIRLMLEPLPSDDAAAERREPRHRRFQGNGGHHHEPDVPPPTETAKLTPPPKDASKPPPATIPTMEITITEDVTAWTVGTTSTQGFRIKGGTPPFSWSLTGTGLSGLGLKTDERDTRTAIITGAPAAAGSASMTLKVNDSTAASASVTYNVVSAAPLKIATTRRVEAILGVPFQTELKAIGGNGPYVWSGERLPAWVAIDAKLGRLQGEPTEAKAAAFSVTVIDASGRRDQVEFKITAIRGIRVFVETAYKAPADLIAFVNEVRTGCLASAPFAIEHNRERADAILMPADYEPGKNHVQLLLNSRSSGLLLWGDTFNRDYVDGQWVLSPETVAKKACGGYGGLLSRAANIMARL
jgi:hypothetical protein